jgi:G3E family GTPase
MIGVNLITGFLGTGKTTLIRHLLNRSPREQRWAVLVNEFGEAGMDGLLLDDTGVAIEEVAGGCLCCVAAPAFSVGLNRLIRQQRPDRILIEPSGLGHPAQILEQLRSPIYSQILDVQATLCVMDARHLASARHREHPNFIDQIHLADVLVANKADRYEHGEEQAFLQFAATLQPPKTRLVMTHHGRVDPALLTLGATPRQASFPEAHAFLLAQESTEPRDTLGNDTWLHFEGEADGYRRAGWLIGGGYRFRRGDLIEWLDGLTHERIKGIFQCRDGNFTYNRADDDTATDRAPDADGSRLQLIDPDPIDPQAIDQALHGLLSGPDTPA